MAKTVFYYFPIGTFYGIIFTWWLSFVFSCGALLKILYSLIVSGNDYFKIKDRTGKNRPACLDAYGTHHFVQLKHQNIKLHYVSNGRTEKPLMLFVHGFPECWFSWRHQMKAFDRDYHVVAMSLRGYCESDKPKGIAQYAIGLLVQDIVELIENLVTKEHPKCILVGHDWGGILTWAVAHIAPNIVSKHIVMNAPHYLDWGELVQTSWLQFVRSWYKVFFNFPIIPEIVLRGNDFKMLEDIFGRHTTNKEEIDAHKYCLSGPYSITAAINFYRASNNGYSAEFEQENRLRHTQIEPDTVILWARDDKYLGASLAQASAKRCRNAKIEYLDNCSHFLQTEQPDRVNTLMRKHLP